VRILAPTDDSNLVPGVRGCGVELVCAAGVASTGLHGDASATESDSEAASGLLAAKPAATMIARAAGLSGCCSAADGSVTAAAAADSETAIDAAKHGLLVGRGELLLEEGADALNCRGEELCIREDATILGCVPAAWDQGLSFKSSSVAGESRRSSKVSNEEAVLGVATALRVKADVDWKKPA
jgi:hypothetical protein